MITEGDNKDKRVETEDKDETEKMKEGREPKNLSCIATRAWRHVK